MYKELWISILKCHVLYLLWSKHVHGEYSNLSLNNTIHFNAFINSINLRKMILKNYFINLQ